MYICLNGEIMRAEEARISPLDHGFLYGAGLFETMRTVGGRPMLWWEHVQRLRQSAERMSISLPWSDEELEGWIIETVQANGLAEAYVRLTVTRGPGALGPSGKGCQTPTLVIYVKELSLPSAHVYEQGRDLLLLQTLRSTPETPMRRKTLNYLNSLLAYQELEERGGSEGIQFSQEGYVVEGAVSNLFFVMEGVLWTPALGTGALPGITRAWVLQQALRRGMRVKEGYITQEDVWTRAREAFTTSSVVGILPATSIEGQPVGDGRVGSTTRDLMDAWSVFVQV